MKKSKRIFFGCLIFLAGIGVFLFPNLRGMQTERKVNDIIKNFEYDDISITRDEAVQYNSGLFESENSVRESAGDLSDVFKPENISTEYPDSEESLAIGYIEIPSISCRLPLYFGATESNLSKGAAVMENTSFPAGGENTNCVIAAHRGYLGSAFFRDINQINPGDIVYISNQWETLSYKAVSAYIVDPSDETPLLINEGEDIVTLVSCHPYVIGGGPERIIVKCVRAENEKNDVISSDNAINYYSDIFGEAYNSAVRSDFCGTNENSLNENCTTSYENIEITSDDTGELLLSAEHILRALFPVVTAAAAILIFLNNHNNQKKKKDI